MTSISQVRLGLSRIGIVGLRQALELADASGLQDRDDIVALMMDALAGSNYVSPASTEEYRRTLWREYLRYCGKDIRHLYAEIEMVVRSEPGPQLDRFCKTLQEVFARHELKPLIVLEPPDGHAPTPQLQIGDEVVVAGTTDPDRIARRVGKQISHW